jgi:hypothetical protein
MIGATDIITIFINDILPEADWWKLTSGHSDLGPTLRLRVENPIRPMGDMKDMPDIIDIETNQSGFVSIFTISVDDFQGKWLYGHPKNLGGMSMSDPKFESEFKKAILFQVKRINPI